MFDKSDVQLSPPWPIPLRALPDTKPLFFGGLERIPRSPYQQLAYRFSEHPDIIKIFRLSSFRLLAFVKRTDTNMPESTSMIALISLFYAY